MTATGEPSNNRLARGIAVLGAACLLSSFVMMVLWATFTAIEATEQVSEKSVLVERMEALAETRRRSDPKTDAGGKLNTFIEGESFAVAAANMQSHLVEALASEGLSPNSIEVRASDEVATIEAPARIQIQIDLEFLEDELPGLLLAAESVEPVLALDEIYISRRSSASANATGTGPGEWEALTGRLVISGFWPGENGASQNGEQNG